MKNRNWFWGIFFLLAAVFLIASQTGAFGQIGALSILATVLLAAILIHGVIELEFFSTFLSLALLYTIYQQPLHLAAISLWLLLLAAILAATGLSILFHGRWRHRKRDNDAAYCTQGACGWDYACHGTDCFNGMPENVDSNNPCVRTHFGASSKYLHSDSLRSGQFYASFGELVVFFDQVQLSPEGAGIFVDCSFGTIRLYLPRQWRVVNHVRAGLGAIKDDLRMSRPEADAPQLTLEGSVQFGELDIHYI